MPQPHYVPPGDLDGVRAGARLPVPELGKERRPTDVPLARRPTGMLMGIPGPDQGFGIKLANSLIPRIKLSETEVLEDVISGCLAVALKRAALFGRAPVIHDFVHAYTLWGFMGSPPRELVEFRKDLFVTASHHYEAQRAIAGSVTEATLRMTPAEVAARLGEWRSLIAPVSH